MSGATAEKTPRVSVGDGGAGAPHTPAIPPLLVVLGLIALFFGIEYPYTLHLPFAGDDYIFLDRTRNADFFSLWRASEGGHNVLAFHYYRPISRELHYWTLTRLFGQWEPPFHLLSMILAAAVGVLYFTLLRRVAGVATAAVATGAVLTLASWGVLVVWVAGAQDLWMMVFALATLLAIARGSPWLASVAFALALLSKETAAAVPAIGLTYLLVVERRGIRAALTRTAGLWALLFIWAAFHPLLGGQLRHRIHEPTIPGLVRPPLWIIAHNLLAVVNLDEVPRPVTGWTPALVLGLAGALIVGILAALGLGMLCRPSLASPSGAPPAPAGRIALWGASWALIAWTPLLMPSLGWHAYYAMFGMLGAWVAIAALLARRPAAALAVLAALAVVRVGRAHTKSSDWGNEWFQRRAALFGRETRDWFQRHYPSLPPYSRIYLSKVPQGVGLVPGGDDSPAFRVWYQDSTLGTYFGSLYRARRAGEPFGRDYLFVYDSLAGWYQDTIVVLPEHPSVRDRESYAQFMWKMSDFAAARAQYEELVRLEPQRWDHAFNLGSVILQQGDTATAVTWYERAARIPGVPAAIVRTAERARRRLSK